MEDPVSRHHIELFGHDTTRKRHAPVCVVAPVLLSQDPLRCTLLRENVYSMELKESLLQPTPSVTNGSWGKMEARSTIAGCGGVNELIEADGLALSIVSSLAKSKSGDFALIFVRSELYNWPLMV